ncbi:MAG: PDZ domain-containing protein [Candidatus Omnitrophota bacterium]
MWKTILTMIVVLSLCPLDALADTVILRNGSRIKGLILDEFKDRIVVSTVDGEKIIMKSDIRSAIYDSEAKALIRKARNHVNRMDYIKAYNTYLKALELDPQLEEAREQLKFLQSYLDVKMKQDIVGSVKDKKEKFQGVSGKIPTEKAVEEFGIVLDPDGKYVCVARALNEAAGVVKPGDKIISVWSELAAYMDAEEVADMLLKSEECKLVIERLATPKLSSNGSRLNNVLANGYEKIIGAKLKLVKKGLIVENVAPGGPFESAGIEKKDMVYRIKGKNTRYMPMRQVIEIIKNNQNKEIEILVRRDVTLWKRGARI